MDESILAASRRYHGNVPCMQMAFNTCLEHTLAVRKREDACGQLVGLIPTSELEDARGWWRLMELACIQDPHEEYTSAHTCRENVIELEKKIAAANNPV